MARHTRNGNRQSTNGNGSSRANGNGDGRLPPHDIVAEQSLLGAMLLTADAIDAGRHLVDSADFYKPSNGNIFHAIVSLVDEQIPVDPVTVADRLDQWELLEVIGGRAELLALQANTPSTSNAARYAMIVREKATLRRAIAVAAEIAETGYAGDLEATVRVLEEAGAVLKTAPQAPPFPVVFVHDVLDEPPAEPPMLLEDLLREGESCALAAPRGIGKTFMGFNLAALLGRGEGMWLGRFAVQKACKVLYCQGELDPWGSFDRWRMLVDASDSGGRRVAETFYRWRVRTVKVRQNLGQSTIEYVDADLDGGLEATIVDHGFDVVVIDPWKVYFSGQENDNDQAEAALDKLRDLSLRRGVTVVLMHHVGKGTDVREPEDLWRGATRLADWAANRITVLPHYTADQAEKQNMTRAQARKYLDVKFLRRSGRALDDISVVFDATTGWWNMWRANDDKDERRVRLTPDDLVDLCNDAGGAWESLREASEFIGVSYSIAGRQLERAVNEGKLDRTVGPKGAKGYRLPGGFAFEPDDEEDF